MDLDVSFEQEAGRCIITVDGEIDVYTSPVLRQQLLSANECDVVIVASGVGKSDLWHIFQGRDIRPCYSFELFPSVHRASTAGDYGPTLPSRLFLR